MGAMSEIDIIVRNCIDEYRQDDVHTRAIKRRNAATRTYIWEEIYEAMVIVDDKKGGN